MNGCGVPLTYTNHALARAQARGIKPYQVDYVVTYGTRSRRADGTVKCVLKPANVPYRDIWSHAALVELTVVLAVRRRELRVITLYFGDKMM